jgi:peptidyl-prolyl cis-trans isomerase SurA
MNLSQKMNIFIVCLVFLITALCDNSNAELVDRIIAIVNDDVVTLSELENQGVSHFQRIRREAPPEQIDTLLERAREDVLDYLISQKIIAHIARKNRIIVDDLELEKMISRTLEQEQLSLAQLREKLKENNVSEKFYQESIRQQKVERLVVSRFVQSKVIISDEQVVEFFEEYYKDNENKGSFHLLQIGVSLAPGSEKITGEMRLIADDIHKRAQAGEDFRELARSSSDLPSAEDGGDIGAFKKEELAGFINEAIADLEVGGISEIVETPVGLQIFKVLRTPESVYDKEKIFESSKEKIRNKLYQQEVEKQYDKWINKQKETAYIKIMP